MVLVFPHPCKLHKHFLFLKRKSLVFSPCAMETGVSTKLTAQREDSKGGRREVRRPKAFTNSLPPWRQEISKRPCRGGLFETSVSANLFRNFLNCINSPHKNAKKGNFRFLFSYQYSISESCSGSPSAAARKSGSFSIGIFWIFFGRRFCSPVFSVDAMFSVL